VQVQTLDNPDALPPDVHIFTASRQPWLMLPESARLFPQFYRREEVWLAKAMARYAALRPALAAWKASQ
jgi:hypothetical protein